MENVRRGGVLLHPTSLPGPFGIGDLGPQAHAFIDWLAESGCQLWQVLPLGPTGYGNSPYQCHSVFAGNLNLVSPEMLAESGLVTAAEVQEAQESAAGATEPARRVDFGRVIPSKRRLLDCAFKRFREDARSADRTEFDDFRTQNADWLDAYCRFMALKQMQGGVSWMDWPAALRHPADPQSVGDNQIRESQLKIAFGQMLFFRQWSELRHHAQRRGVRIIGDIPIFASEDSADVWARPELFQLDERKRPVAVAGVPPDYFSPTGQLWGNPLYRWDAHAQTGYKWWTDRLRAVLGTVDIARFDHFRGLAAYWQIPAGAPTAATGRWVPGPGEKFLQAVLGEMGPDGHQRQLHLIAEDLGVVTPDVRRLLELFDLPGMRVLQFGLAGHYEDFLPDRYEPNCVAYTGTHDNDTARGWFTNSSAAERRFALGYLRSTEKRVVQDMIRAVWISPARWAIVPVQDLLDLGPEARMNFPGKPVGNWEWRLQHEQLSRRSAEWLHGLNLESGRLETP